MLTHLVGFGCLSQMLSLLCSDQLLKNRTKLRVKMEHLQKFDKELTEALINRPEEYLEQLELAAGDVLATSRHREDDGSEPERSSVQVRGGCVR